LDHLNIAQIFGLERTPDFTTLVMELIEGDDLSQRIARGAIPVEEALPIAKQIAEALEAAHEQGNIHRDLKARRARTFPGHRSPSSARDLFSGWKMDGVFVQRVWSRRYFCPTFSWLRRQMANLPGRRQVSDMVTHGRNFSIFP
jgi:hypothetical protein